MPNRYFNQQVSPEPQAAKGKGTKGFMGSAPGGMKAAFKEKPGFGETAQGPKQKNDRSAGIPRAKVHPHSDGI